MDASNFKLGKIYRNDHRYLEFELMPVDAGRQGHVYAGKQFILRDYNMLKRYVKEATALRNLLLESQKSVFLPVMVGSFDVQRVSPVLVTLSHSRVDMLELVGHADEIDAKFYASEILCGMAYLHKRGIVHQNLSLKTIFLTPWGHLLLSNLEYAFESEEGVLPETEDFAEDLVFSAPEVITKTAISPKSDIYSLGMIVLLLVALEAVALAVSGREFDLRILENLEPAISKSLIAFARRCLDPHYKARPSLEEVKGMKFFKGIDWQEAESGCRDAPINPYYIKRRECPPKLNPSIEYRLITECDKSISKLGAKKFKEFISPNYGKIGVHPRMSGSVGNILKSEQSANQEALRRAQNGCQ